LNKRFCWSAGLGDSLQPPLQELPKDFSAVQQSTRGSPELAHGSAWQPNLNAPEFIPTLSMQCPVIWSLPSVQPPVQAQPTFPPQMASSFPTQPSIFTPPVTTPVKGRPPSPSGANSGKKKAGRKRLSSGCMQEPPKRTRSEEREDIGRPTVNAFAEAMRNGTPTTFPIPEAAPRTPPSGRPCEEATEEDWQRRIEMRKKAVDIVKKYPEYKWCAEASQEKGDGPCTPNPKDRAISKRRWKYLTAQWRLALKTRCTEDGQGSAKGSAAEARSTRGGTEDMSLASTGE